MKGVLELALSEAFGPASPLPTADIGEITRIIDGIVAAQPSALEFYNQKPRAQLRELATALRQFLTSQRHFEILMVVVGSVLDDDWLANLGRTIGDAVSENPHAVAWWFAAVEGEHWTRPMLRALLFLAFHIRERHAEEFRSEFGAFLGRPGKLIRCATAASVLDQSDMDLLKPLGQLLEKVKALEAPDREVRKERDEVADVLEKAIRRIEGKPERKKWWKFGRA